MRRNGLVALWRGLVLWLQRSLTGIFMSIGDPKLSVLLALAITATSIVATAAELPTMRSAQSKRAQTCHVGGMTGVIAAGGVCIKVSGSVTAGVDMGSLKSK
jgi:hypothetical protein